MKFAGRRLAVASLVATVACASGLGSPPSPAALRADSITTQRLADGVEWTRFVRLAGGPFVVNVVRADLRRSLVLEHVRAKDSLRGRERLSSMVARHRAAGDSVVAAINADFFSLATGENENNQVIGGEWWKGLRGTNSPYDAFDNVHAQFGVVDGRPVIDRFVVEGTVIHGGTAFPLTAVNFVARGASEGAVLYTPRMSATPRDTTRPAAEAPLRRVGEFGDTLVYVLTGGAAKGSGRAVPRDGAVLAAYGARSTAVAAFADRDTVRIVLRASANRGDGPLSSPALLIGGWPRILRDGANVAARAPWDEGTLSSNAEARHPRSAIGYTRDRRTLLLVTVDGRQKTSVGMTLVELADLLKVEGAWDALNFDGGGSTTLIAGRGIVNTPSDSAGERAIGNALLILKRK